MDEIAALTSFVSTMVMAMPLFIIAWIMLRRVRRRAERAGGAVLNGTVIHLAGVVIRTMIVLAAFPVALYLVSGGPRRAESTLIVSILVFVPLGIIAAAETAVTVVRILRNGKKNITRPED